MRSESEIRYQIRLHVRSQEIARKEMVALMRGPETLWDLQLLRQVQQEMFEHMSIVALPEWMLGERDIQPGSSLRSIGERKG